jgi:hypothetical protein
VALGRVRVGGLGGVYTVTQSLLRVSQFLLRTSQCMLGGARWG